MTKPITELKKLLGFSTAQEVADFLGITKSTADNLNSRRGYKDLRNTCLVLCRALKALPASQRRSFFDKPKSKARTQAEKFDRVLELKEELRLLPARIAENFEAAQEDLNRFSMLSEEYAELTRL